MYRLFFYSSITFLLVFSIYAAVYQVYHLLNGYNIYTIKESLDNAIDGIYFEDGQFLIYENIAITELFDCLKIQSKSTHDIWQALEQLKVKGSDENTFIVPINDKYYAFIKHSDKKVNQIFAFSIDEEYRATLEVENLKRQLEERQAEIKKALQGIELIEKEKERLRMKSKLHDVFGQRLYILHSLLEKYDYKSTNIMELKKMLKSTTNEIQTDDDKLTKERVDSIISSFKMIGLEIDINGQFPKDETLASELIKIIRESATNSIRHGHATKLSISFIDNSMCITDNGTGSDKEYITLGTGLKGMQNRIERLGGTFRLVSCKPFTIIIDYHFYLIGKKN